MRFLARWTVLCVIFLVAFVLVARVVFGGGRHLPDQSGSPMLASRAIEEVARLPYPPGNIAVSSAGRIFFTFHPDGQPPVRLVELVDGKPVPYPDAAFQQAKKGSSHFQSPLAIRIDAFDRLWVLDYARYGVGQPRLLAFSLGSGKLIHSYDFPTHVAGLLSMLNDFQVSPDGTHIYIAETSPFLQTSALIVYDTVRRISRRVLHRHPSVQAKDWLIQAPGRDMNLFGVYTLRLGVDSIALDAAGEWLYYGPVSDDRLYRVRTADLDDTSLPADQLSQRVEDFGPKPLSDGLSMDLLDNVYLTDPEHSAILRLSRERELSTVVRDPRLRWPDGLGFGPDGWLYVTSSALHEYIFRAASEVPAHAPYGVFRLRLGIEGVPGR